MSSHHGKLWIAAATLAVLATGATARASELSEIRDTQKQILQRLDAQDKVLREIQQRLSGAGGRPAEDPNKVYTINLGKSAIRGPKNAPVTIVEFSDFQCPFCRQAAPVVDEVLKAYPKEVRFVYKQFPLTQIHPRALPASKAALAAGNQGKFWEMFEELMNAQRQGLTDADIHDAAEKVGLDVKRFETDLASAEVQKAVDEDMEAARSVDVRGTPTFFVNGRKVQNRSVEGFKALIDEELKKKS
jgi:protein-disulfide isomerase